MNEIAAFLADGKGGFKRGLELLRKTPQPRADIRELEGYAQRAFAPAHALQKLYALLRGHLIVPQNGITADSTSPVVTAPQFTIVQNAETCPPSVQALRVREKELRAERQAIHATIEDTTDDLLRAEKVVSVRTLTRKIDDCWTAIDKWENERIVPVAVNDDSETDPIKLKNQLLSDRSRVSVLNGKNYLGNKDLPESKRLRYKRELSEKTERIRLIEQKLGKP